MRSRRPSTRESARSGKDAYLITSKGEWRARRWSSPSVSARRVVARAAAMLADAPNATAAGWQAVGGVVCPVHSDLVRAAGPAAAGDSARADDRVVVGQLFAPADIAPGADPDRLVYYLEPAVRRARVVDEPRDVAADVRIAAPVPVHPEHPDTALGEVPLLALFAFVVAHQLAGVVDDAAVLRNMLRREHAVSMDRRSAPDDFRQRLRPHT